MVAYTNFYESLAEANMRLKSTIVLYDDLPFVVLGIANHPDGIFRVYLEPLKQSPYELSFQTDEASPASLTSSTSDLGPLMDKWMKEKGEKFGVIRKHINSTSFKKFRPFPLGMCNTQRGVYYIERNPNRKTEQGLLQSMLLHHHITISPKPSSRDLVNIYSGYFKDCIVGNYPTVFWCLDNLLDPNITNEAIAFDRNFALIRGPLDTIFLSYKSDIIGILPNQDLSSIRLGKNASYTREVVENLGIFSQIQD